MNHLVCRAATAVVVATLTLGGTAAPAVAGSAYVSDNDTSDVGGYEVAGLAASGAKFVNGERLVKVRVDFVDLRDGVADSGFVEMLGTRGRRWIVYWEAGGRPELQRWFSDPPQQVRCRGLKWKVSVPGKTITVKVPQRCMKLGCKAKFRFGVTNEAPAMFLSDFVPSSVSPDTGNPVSEYTRYVKRS